MDEEMKDRVFDVYHEMRGMVRCSTPPLMGVWPSRSNSRVCVGQVARLSDALAAAIRDCLQP